MKKIIFALIVIIMTTPAFAASKDPVKLRWTSRGIDFSSPAYTSQTRQVKSELRYYENLPKREVRKSFRTLDRKINDKLRNIFR